MNTEKRANPFRKYTVSWMLNGYDHAAWMQNAMQRNRFVMYNIKQRRLAESK
jgi:hypothetical protein